MSSMSSRSAVATMSELKVLAPLPLTLLPRRVRSRFAWCMATAQAGRAAGADEVRRPNDSRE